MAARMNCGKMRQIDKILRRKSIGASKFRVNFIAGFESCKMILNLLNDCAA
jgi:hypothetical protein